MFNIENLLQALPIMGKGMLGIFIVIGVLVLSVALLNVSTKKKNK